MVNGNYVLYGDRPSSESETVDDHVQTRTAERKTKRKSNRSSKDSHNHKTAELDNETDAVKYEKKIKEPRLLRYVPTTDIEENYITEKFETYDLKPTEDLPRRHAFMKKPKNPADGSVNYAYSRSSSSCSSPNLPTISEHGEQYGTYRVRSSLTPPISNPITGYETKLDKYFAKPREVKTFAAKVGYDGSHPDSLYRVPSDSANGADKFMRGVRFLRWPLALFTVCVALAVFVYFLMPANMNAESDRVNATFWEEGISQAQSHTDKNHIKHELNKGTEKSRSRGTKTPEIDFYDPDNGQNNDLTTLIDIITERSQKRKLPIPPVFPTHISPEVQYGNDRVDTDKTRTPKILKDATTVSSDSTIKPHITQKPEKPLAVYFKDGDGVTTTSANAVPTAENIANAETSNDITAYVKQQSKKNGSPEIQINEVPSSTISSLHDSDKAMYAKQNNNAEPKLPPELQEFYDRPVIDSNGKFTSGHSKLFGISIEDAENMKSTTQNSVYNTRVSPTLPTWRNRDDSTTKKYPISGYYEVPQCRSTGLSLCRGVLPYDLATGPASVGDVDVTTLIPQIEYLVNTNCSQRVRHFTCALLEPECSPPPYSQKLPCYNFCKAIVDHCESFIPRELQAMFSCNQYPSNNCASARSPCYSRELACGDGTCVPRDWICDGTRDCIGGEDEAPCSKCEDNEYRCSSGMCITTRWLCDGYADCPSGEDEHKELCQGRRLVNFQREEDIDEPGEESAGSAPALSVRKPNRLPFVYDRINGNRNGENDNSKELLMTSDSNNAFRRNFTRRPSPSRLTPYKRPRPLEIKPDADELLAVQEKFKSSIVTQSRKPQNVTKIVSPKQKEENQDSTEDINLDDLELFEDIEKVKPRENEKSEKMEKSENMENKHVPRQNVRKQMNRGKPMDGHNSPAPIRTDKMGDKLERVIDGASMLRKAAQAQREEILDSPETNISMADKTEELSLSGYNSAHASPCPSGELRCVDGRCITLDQLCDGTIDCSDHADEDNCYT